MEVLWQQLLTTSWIEFMAVLFGLWSVWLSRIEHIGVYPTGMVSVLLYVYITWQYKIYADSIVNTYYFLMSIYGWYFWTHSKNSLQRPITKNTFKENIFSLLICLSLFFIIRFLLMKTDSSIPNWDAMTTAFAMTAMWLMARKKIENWIAWILTDIISIPLYIYKGLPFTSFQFLVFTILAIFGLLEWNKRWRLYNE